MRHYSMPSVLVFLFMSCQHTNSQIEFFKIKWLLNMFVCLLNNRIHIVLVLQHGPLWKPDNAIAAWWRSTRSGGCLPLPTDVASAMRPLFRNTRITVTCTKSKAQTLSSFNVGQTYIQIIRLFIEYVLFCFYSLLNVRNAVCSAGSRFAALEGGEERQQTVKRWSVLVHCMTPAGRTIVRAAACPSRRLRSNSEMRKVWLAAADLCAVQTSSDSCQPKRIVLYRSRVKCI